MLSFPIDYAEPKLALNSEFLKSVAWFPRQPNRSDQWKSDNTAVRKLRHAQRWISLPIQFAGEGFMNREHAMMAGLTSSRFSDHNELRSIEYGAKRQLENGIRAGLLRPGHHVQLVNTQADSNPL
jgi:hypothetical protein